MVYERGIAYGGSFLDPGYDILIDSEKPYDAPSPLLLRGRRLRRLFLFAVKQEYQEENDAQKDKAKYVQGL